MPIRIEWTFEESPKPKRKKHTECRYYKCPNTEKLNKNGFCPSHARIMDNHLLWGILSLVILIFVGAILFAIFFGDK